ncbi:U4/U6 small nuclear ribonucleoprotein Prp31 homolog [Rhododendron vialii]|uniref:U4/U6 small nuclear ribonucleoprotein Prp31 homolog n=1 Tax=Rhododendron vialii TaxID=182163 RepID=UPI00265E3FB4|nr:U4/U6 small nuclear ribonucleoprotein Prp31 homolog [Rhododendron vialii]
MEVLGPTPYARAVKKIGNEMDLALVDLKEVLSLADIGRVSWKGIGKPLPEEILQKTFDACDPLLALHSDYEKVHAFVGCIMEYFEPNLCAIFGSEVASKLIVGTAGGLSAVANIPADDFSLVGAKKIMDLQRFFAEMPPCLPIGGPCGQKFYSGSADRLDERRSNR